MSESAARAEPPPPITNNEYAIEFFQGPLLAPTRILGFSGAYTAYAEGVDGTASNAAAPAVREPYSLRWFDWDVAPGISFPGAYGGTDFSNTGARDERVNRFLLLSVGGQMQFGAFGASLTGELLQYSLAQPAGTGGAGLQLRYARFHALVAHAFVDDQVVVGAGARVVYADISQSGTGTLLSMTGAGPEVGIVVKPNDRPFRVGATIRAPVRTQPVVDVGPDSTGVRRAGAFVLPSRVEQPWEADFGVAIQLGPRPLNPPWVNPHDQEERAGAKTDEEKRALYDARKARYENWPREKVLILASALVTGQSETAVALEGFLDQKRDYVGQRVTVTPRFGMESEPVPDRVALRVGTYLEPSRFREGVARQHFTVGGDLKLFTWDFFNILSDTTFRASVAVDIAPRYQNFGVGLGVWH